MRFEENRRARFALMAALTFAIVSGVGTSSADAALFRIQASAGVVDSIQNGSPEAAAGFQVGETLTFQFVFNENTPDADNTVGVASYTDPKATYSLIGNSSGATLFYAPGLTLSIPNDMQIDIASSANPASASATPVIRNGIDWVSTSTLLSDVDDLSQVFTDLFGTPITNTFDFVASTAFWSGITSALGMTFSGPPDDSEFVLLDIIPEPGALSLILISTLFCTCRQRRLR